MRVYDVNLTGASAAGSAKSQETQRTDSSGSIRGGSAGGSGNADRVEFSSALGSLSRALSADGSARANRVQHLAALYQSGSYHPDSMATSRAMVSDALAGAGK